MDNENDNVVGAAPGAEPVPTTDDGIPLIANEQELDETAIQALREARERERNRQETVDLPKEVGGPNRKEPTRYGDWERDGRVIDF